MFSFVLVPSLRLGMPSRDSGSGWPLEPESPISVPSRRLGTRLPYANLLLACLSMSLFSKPPPTNPEKLAQIKSWTTELLALNQSTPISISQLRCHEPGCSPIETVIAVMTTSPQTYKVHKAASDVDYQDVVDALT